MEHDTSHKVRFLLDFTCFIPFNPYLAEVDQSVKYYQTISGREGLKWKGGKVYIG